MSAEATTGRRPSRPRSVRRQAREQLTAEIVAEARRQLDEVGAAALSLRSVARELGMVSSAVYRYVTSRDELLTLLIAEAYDALGETVEREAAAASGVDGDLSAQTLVERWLAACTAMRQWCLAHPQEHALIFGSPVPGYAAPQTTIEPAARVPRVLIGLLVEGVRAGVLDPGALPAAPDDVVRALAPLDGQVLPELPAELTARGIAAWTMLVGAVSFELFGHTHNVVDDDPALREAFFVDQMRRSAQQVFMTAGPAAASPAR